MNKDMALFSDSFGSVCCKENTTHQIKAGRKQNTKVSRKVNQEVLTAGTKSAG